MPLIKEAEKMWCPMGRNSYGANISFSRGGTGDERMIGDDCYRCITNKCMMWRWITQGREEEFQIGYCGLAGQEGGIT